MARFCTASAGPGAGAMPANGKAPIRYVTFYKEDSKRIGTECVTYVLIIIFYFVKVFAQHCCLLLHLTSSDMSLINIKIQITTTKCIYRFLT